MNRDALIGTLQQNGQNVNILGYIIWPELESVDTTAEWFAERLVQLGFNDSYAREHNYRSAFRRCIKNLEAKRIIRLIHEDQSRILYQFTAEHLVEEEERLEYTTETQVEVDKGIYWSTNDFGQALVKGSPEIRSKLAEMFESEKTRYKTTDVSRYIKKILRNETDMVSIRKQGSVYFVPASGEDVVNRLRQLLTMVTAEGQGEANLGSFPLVDSEASRQQVSDNIESEVLEILTNMQAEVDEIQNGKTVTDRWVEHRLSKIQNVKSRIDMYARVLGGKQIELNGKADDLLNVTRALEV